MRHCALIRMLCCPARSPRSNSSRLLGSAAKSPSVSALSSSRPCYDFRKGISCCWTRSGDARTTAWLRGTDGRQGRTATAGQRASLDRGAQKTGQLRLPLAHMDERALNGLAVSCDQTDLPPCRRTDLPDRSGHGRHVTGGDLRHGRATGTGERAVGGRPGPHGRRGRAGVPEWAGEFSDARYRSSRSGYPAHGTPA